MAQIFSGIQPSGELHIGNYLGAVKNWVQLQAQYPGAIFCIVDYHAITGAYDPAVLRARRREMAVSLLAAGIDPAQATLFLQSAVPEHTELAWIFNTITPLGELERQTQYKDKASRQESVATGILTYPVLQAADILLYRGDAVPVGEDQVQHLELSREIARKWNARFARDDAPYFPEPKALLTPTRRIMGLDGQAKMSKSLGNTIGLLESRDEIWAKLRPAVTDPARVRKTDPGTPEVCNIYHLHKAFISAADGRRGRGEVPYCGLGMHRVQTGAARARRRRADADPRAGRRDARHARAGTRCARCRRGAVPQHRRGDDRARQGCDGADRLSEAGRMALALVGAFTFQREREPWTESSTTTATMSSLWDTRRVATRFGARWRSRRSSR